MTYSGHRKYRQELEILQTEKSIVNGAITRVFEAFQKGKLDKVEFDRLMSKYNEESQMYEEKIKQIEPMVDFSELKTLRGDLLHLVKEKINNIDMKLGEISKNNRISTNSIISIFCLILLYMLVTNNLFDPFVFAQGSTTQDTIMPVTLSLH